MKISGFENMTDDKGEMNIEQMKEMFELISDKIPTLLESVTKVLYNAQEGEKFGQSVASFYKTLKAAGMSSEEAFDLTKEYMSTVSLGGLLKSVVGGASKEGKDD
jgi:hypothetical protein